jgi:hypothetical protein
VVGTQGINSHNNNIKWLPTRKRPGFLRLFSGVPAPANEKQEQTKDGKPSDYFGCHLQVSSFSYEESWSVSSGSLDVTAKGNDAVNRA